MYGMTRESHGGCIGSHEAQRESCDSNGRWSWNRSGDSAVVCAKVAVNYNTSEKAASMLAGETKKMGREAILVKADVSSEEACVYLWVTCRLSQLRMDKWITMKEREDGVEVRHRITNISEHDLEYFFWMSHATVPCVESSRIDIPARRLQVGEVTRSCRFNAGSYT